MWAVRLNTAVRAKDAGKTIGNIRTLLGKSMAVVNLLLSDALMHRFYILGEKIRLAALEPPKLCSFAIRGRIKYVRGCRPRR